MVSEKDREFAVWCIQQGFSKEQVKQILLKKGYSGSEIDEFLNSVSITFPKKETKHKRWIFLFVIIGVVLGGIIYSFLVSAPNPEPRTVAQVWPAENQNVSSISTKDETENKTTTEELNIILLDCFVEKNKYALVFRVFEDYRNVTVAADNTTLGRFNLSRDQLFKLELSEIPNYIVFSENNRTKSIEVGSCGQ